jgi:hypothetical protein
VPDTNVPTLYQFLSLRNVRIFITKKALNLEIIIHQTLTQLPADKGIITQHELMKKVE